MSDTTAVNTGLRKGINSRLKNFFNKFYGRDIHTFECLLHINELYLTHLIKFKEGDSKAPNKMQDDAIYNLIEELDPEDLSRENLADINNNVEKVEVGDMAVSVLDHAINLASTWKRERKGK